MKARFNRAILAGLVAVLPLSTAVACGMGYGGNPKVASKPKPERSLTPLTDCKSPVRDRQSLVGESDQIVVDDLISVTKWVGRVNAIRRLCHHEAGDFNPSQIQERSGDYKYAAGVTADGCLIPTQAGRDLGQPLCFQPVSDKRDGRRIKGSFVKADAFTMVRAGEAGIGERWVFKNETDKPTVFVWHEETARGGVDFFYTEMIQPTYQALVMVPSVGQGEFDRDDERYGEMAGEERDDHAEIWVVEKKGSGLALVNHGKIGDYHDKSDAINRLESKIEPIDEQWLDFLALTRD